MARSQVGQRLAAVPARRSRVVSHNRITMQLASVPIRDSARLEKGLRAVDYTPVELAPAFDDAYARSRHRAVALARAYATTLPNADEHRQLFQRAAYMKQDERLALIEGYRKAGQGRAVVHAVSQLPRAHGRLIMRDLALKPDGTTDSAAARDVFIWLRDAGAQIRAMQAGLPPHEHDDAVVEFFEDVADAISDAVNAVVDALGAVGNAFVDAIKDIVNWAADAVEDLARALLEAFETLGELLVDVVRGRLPGRPQDHPGAGGDRHGDARHPGRGLHARAGRPDHRPACDRQPRAAARRPARDHRRPGGQLDPAARSTPCSPSASRSATSSSRHVDLRLALVKGVVGALLALGKAVGEILVTARHPARSAPAADRQLAARPRSLAENDPGQRGRRRRRLHPPGGPGGREHRRGRSST